jgi:hypothetical protein
VDEYREKLLRGRWVHSHEEDTDDEMVFRPETHPFPPSRGRVSFELRPDGTYAASSPGPVDVPESSTGLWSLEGGRLILGTDHDRPDHLWEITGVNDRRLTVRR